MPPPASRGELLQSSLAEVFLHGCTSNQPTTTTSETRARRPMTACRRPRQGFAGGGGRCGAAPCRRGAAWEEIRVGRDCGDSGGISFPEQRERVRVGPRSPNRCPAEPPLPRLAAASYGRAMAGAQGPILCPVEPPLPLLRARDGEGSRAAPLPRVRSRHSRVLRACDGGAHIR
jgi:hypothetical protein